MGSLNLEKIIGAVLGVVLGVVITVAGLNWNVVHDSLCGAPIDIKK